MGHGFGPNLQRLIHRYWDKQKVVPKAWKYFGRPFFMKRGVTQGKPVSPTIFNIVLDAEKEWLTPRIEQRFDLMVGGGAMDEIASMDAHYDPSLPSCRAIGVPELIKCHRGELDLQTAREEACIATRQFAKRQRTWFRSKMKNWNLINTKEM